MVQWLRFLIPSAGNPGSIHSQGTRSHKLQLKIAHATTKTWYSQINKFFLKKENTGSPKSKERFLKKNESNKLIAGGESAAAPLKRKKV